MCYLRALLSNDPSKLNDFRNTISHTTHNGLQHYHQVTWLQSVKMSRQSTIIKQPNEFIVFMLIEAAASCPSQQMFPPQDLSMSVITVSYTHLDVYKRQV